MLNYEATDDKASEGKGYFEQSGWVLLWLPTAMGFHIEPAVEMIKTNLRCFKEGKKIDWVCIFMHERLDVVEEFCQIAKKHHDLIQENLALKS